MLLSIHPAEWMLALVIILSSLGVILLKQPVHACLSFLMTLLSLATIYLQLSAHFIAAMQVLVYAGAILVIFMFVIVLFQDAHSQIAHYKSQSVTALLAISGVGFLGTLIFLGYRLMGGAPLKKQAFADFGTVEALGKTLYLDFFFPFEAVILIFLVAIVGALYIGKKVES